jgi:hypothetical protein
MIPDSQAPPAGAYGLGMQSTPSPGGLSRDSRKFRGGLRAAEAVLRASKAEFAAEMAALSALAARRIQQSRDLLDAQSSPATPTDKSDRLGSSEPNPSCQGSPPPPVSPPERQTPLPILSKPQLPARRSPKRPYAGSALLSVSAHPNSPSLPPRWETPPAGSDSQPGFPPSILVERVNGHKTPTVTSRRGVDAIPPIKKVAPPMKFGDQHA